MTTLIRRLVLLILLLAPTQPTAAAETVITDVRIGLHGLQTRFVLDLSGPVTFNLFTLGNPHRVVVDFPDLAWRTTEPAGAAGRGVVAAFRHGNFRPGTFRVVLDLSGPASVSDAFILPPGDGQPHRFVLDLQPTSEQAFAAGLASQRPPYLSPRVEIPKMKPRLGEKRIVAIDAGHGGLDPGAIGVGGTREKDIVLAMARELRDRLEATGRYKVFLTRDSDTFLKLRERVELARGAGAELFISLHADSHPRRDTTGASVYTLSETASDAEAAALAEKENKSDVIAGVDLSTEDVDVANILIDLAQRETMNRSAVFARTLISRFNGDVPLLGKSHRFAGFAVLKAPDVPSVLIELGYLSNPAEETRLRTAAYRSNIAGAIVAAVDAFFRQQEQLSRT